MRKFAFLVIFVSFLFLVISVNAKIFASDANKIEKTTFYSNETVYVFGNESVTNIGKSIRVYVVSNSDSWSNGTALTGLIQYITTTTNSSGFLPLTTVWAPESTVGSYDVVIDVNNDGVYNKSIDYVANETSVGFQVLATPKPTLAFSLGEKNPPNHSWNYTNASESLMMQIKVAGSGQDATIASLDLLAGGSGDDKSDISLVSIYTDYFGNGVVDGNDSLVAFEKYSADNGVFSQSFKGSQLLKTDNALYFLITYRMGTGLSNGETFNLQLVSVSASGASGSKAAILGLPLSSSTRTIIGPSTSQENKAQTQPPSSCLKYSNETNCTDAGCRWCKSDNSCRIVEESCPIICSGEISITINQIQDLSEATISGLTNCENKIIRIKENNCNSETIVSCNATGEGCLIAFPSSIGEHTYYACIDKNEDNVFESSEQTSQIISVQQQTKQKAEATEKPEEGFNYLIVIIPIAIVLVIVFVYFFFLRKRIDGYEKLKEKWKKKKQYTY